MVKKRIASLQGLKGYAILLVIISHYSFFTNKYGHNIFYYAGCIGVGIFIIVSGYLTYWNYTETKEYFKSRIIRIYPLFIITFLLAIPLQINLKDFNSYLANFPKAVCNLLLINAWIPNQNYYYSFNSVSWFLTLVVFFALVTKPLIKQIKKTTRRTSIILLTIIIVIEIILSLVFQNKTYSHWLLYICPAVRLLDYINGMLLCKIMMGKTRVNEKNNYALQFGIIATIIIVLVLLETSFFINSDWYLNAVWIISILLLLGMLVCEEGTVDRIIFKNKIILFIASISFELFLIHQLVIRYMDRISKRIALNNSIIEFILSFALSIMLAYGWSKIWKSVKRSLMGGK